MIQGAIFRNGQSHGNKKSESRWLLTVRNGKNRASALSFLNDFCFQKQYYQSGIMLLEIIEDPNNKEFIIVTSQHSIELWIDYIGETQMLMRFLTEWITCNKDRSKMVKPKKNKVMIVV